jgi:hypothetical protein
MARREKVKMVLVESAIPDTAMPGTIFVARDTQTVWAAGPNDGTGQGRVVCLTDALLKLPIHAAPRDGKPGRDGVDGRSPSREEILSLIRSIRDEFKGERGSDGVSNTPGPAGERGPQGLPGRDGRSPSRDQIREFVKEVVSEMRDQLRGEPGQSIVGPAGPKGDRGDITIVGNAELQNAVAALKAQIAKYRAAIQLAKERNADTHNPTLRAFGDAIVRTIEGHAR